MSSISSSYDAETAHADLALRELREARERLKERHLDWLMRRGVDLETLCLIDYGVARIRTERRRFWPSSSGDPAVILAVCGGDTKCWSPDLFDLAAFRTGEPGKSYSLSGAAPWYNPWAIEDSCRTDMPLTVYRSLLDCLRAGVEGAVPLVPWWRTSLIRSLTVYVAPPTIEPKLGPEYAGPRPEGGASRSGAVSGPDIRRDEAREGPSSRA